VGGGGERRGGFESRNTKEGKRSKRKTRSKTLSTARQGGKNLGPSPFYQFKEGKGKRLGGGSQSKKGIGDQGFL